MRIITCSNCGEEKAVHAKGLCKACYDRQWKINNPERHRQSRELYRANHKEESRAYWQKWYQQHGQSYFQEYYNANKEQQKARTYRWRAKNKERHREYSRRWARENPERQRAKTARREARKRGAANTLRQEQLDFEMNIARSMWPSEKLHLHHIVPLSKGGNHSWGNIMVIPASLNCSIGDKLPEEAYEQLPFVR